MDKRVLIPENWGPIVPIVYRNKRLKVEHEVLIRRVPDDFGGDKLALVCDPRYPDMNGNFMFFRADRQAWMHVKHGLFALYRCICYIQDACPSEYPDYRPLVMELILLVEEQLTKARKLLAVIDRNLDLLCNERLFIQVRENIRELYGGVVPCLTLKPYNHLLRDEVRVIAQAFERGDWKTLHDTVHIALSSTRLLSLRKDLELAKLHLTRRVKGAFVDDSIIRSIQDMLALVRGTVLPDDLASHLHGVGVGIVLEDYERALTAIDLALVLI
ncbi:MAG: hypothetical protein V1848_00550 [Candidatus Magasanikbacteria bacterium]